MNTRYVAYTTVLVVAAAIVSVAAVVGCGTGYPQNLADCTSVLVTATDLGCDIHYDACPANGHGTLECAPENGGTFICKCSFAADDFFTHVEGDANAPADPTVCTRNPDGLRALAKECG